MTTRNIANLIKLHFRLNWRQAIFYLAGLTIYAIIAYYSGGSYAGLDEDRINRIFNQHRSIYFVSTIILGFAYTLRTAFKGYGNKREVASTLLLPAPTASKFMAEWISTFILFPLMMIAVWFITESIALWRYTDLSSFSIPLSEDVWKADGFITTWAIVHSITFLVRSAGKKWFALLFVAAIIMVPQLPLHYTYPFQSIMSEGLIYMDGSLFRTFYPISIFSEQIDNVVSLFFTLTLPVAMYALGYLRLKVREV